MRALIVLVLVAFSITANAVELPKPQEGGDIKGVEAAVAKYNKHLYSGTYIVEVLRTPAYFAHYGPKNKKVSPPGELAKVRITVGEEHDYALVAGISEAGDIIKPVVSPYEFYRYEIECLEQLRGATSSWDWYAGNDTYVAWSTHGWTIMYVKDKLPVKLELGNFKDDGPPNFFVFSEMRDGRYTRLDDTSYLRGTSTIVMTMSVTKQPDSKELMEALKKGVIEAKAAKAAEEAEARAICEFRNNLTNLLPPDAGTIYSLSLEGEGGGEGVNQLDPCGVWNVGFRPHPNPLPQERGRGANPRPQERMAIPQF